MDLRRFLEIKTSVFGVVIIVAATSVLTAQLTVRFNSSQKTPQTHIPSNGDMDPRVTAQKLPSVVDCERGFYSPIQRRCVSQTVFNSEMARLFIALGLDPSPYFSRDQNEN